MWWQNKNRGEAILWHQEAIALQQRGRFREARDKLEKAIEVFRKSKEQSLLAGSLSQLSQIYLHEGDLKNSMRYAGESAQIRTEILDYAGLAIDYQMIGTLLMMAGQLREAEGYFKDSLGLATLLKNDSLAASAESNLGIVAFELNNYTEAEKHFQSSQNIRKKEGDKLGIAKNLNHLGKIKEATGKANDAAKLYQESLSILRELGAPEAKIALDNLNRVQRQR